MKYKVGDKVRVIKNPSGSEIYYMDDHKNSDAMIKEMRERAGKVVTIREANSSGYRIREDTWHWVDGMFSGLVVDADPETVFEPEPIPKPEGSPKFKCGDRLRVRSNLTSGKSYLTENGTSLKHPECWHCNSEMEERAGSVMTVCEVGEKQGYIFYKMAEDAKEWCWSADMFDGLATEEAPRPAPELHTDWSWEDLF